MSQQRSTSVVQKARAEEVEKPRAPGTEGGNLSFQAYHRIKDMVLDRQLRGGDTIVEERLAEKLDISRTPLREALVRLAGEGLLVKQGSRSFTVRRVTASEFFQSMRVREILEAEAVDLAAGKVDLQELAEVRDNVARLADISQQTKEHWQADDRVHELFARASGNHVMAKIIHELHITTRLFEVARPFGRMRVDAEEHLAILNAYEQGDVAAARRAMRHHLKQLQRDVMQILSGG